MYPYVFSISQRWPRKTEGNFVGSTTFWKLNLWCAFITSPCFSSSGFFQPTYILRKMVKNSYTTEVKLSSWIFQASSKTWLLLSCRVFSLQNVKHEIHFLKNKIFTALKWNLWSSIQFSLYFLTSRKVFLSTLKWPWLETKTEKSKQHFYVAKKAKSFWLLYHSWWKLDEQHKVKGQPFGLFYFFAMVDTKPAFQKVHAFCLWSFGESILRSLESIKKA